MRIPWLQGVPKLNTGVNRLSSTAAGTRPRACLQSAVEEINKHRSLDNFLQVLFLGRTWPLICARMSDLASVPSCKNVCLFLGSFLGDGILTVNNRENARCE